MSSHLNLGDPINLGDPNRLNPVLYEKTPQTPATPGSTGTSYTPPLPDATHTQKPESKSGWSKKIQLLRENTLSSLKSTVGYGLISFTLPINLIAGVTGGVVNSLVKIGKIIMAEQKEKLEAKRELESKQEIEEETEDWIYFSRGSASSSEEWEDIPLEEPAPKVEEKGFFTDERIDEITRAFAEGFKAGITLGSFGGYSLMASAQEEMSKVKNSELK